MRTRPARTLLVAASVLALASSALPSAATPSVPAGAGLATDPIADALGHCDPLDPALCLLPFPNDLFTVEDPTTDTGRRVDFAVDAMPRNIAGKPIDPSEWNRNDGFSPGAMVLTFVPELDLHATWGTQDEATSLPETGPNEPGYFDHRDHLADIGRYQQPDAPIVIIDAETGERHPFWSELDTHPDTPDDRRLLILRPAANFEEGHRYVVALRDLRRADGSVIEPRAEFTAYRDGTATDARAAHMEELFTTLEGAGIARDDLYLAWDFTVASERDLSERVLHIRDEAFARLGDTDLADRAVEGESPTFAVESVQEFQDQDPDGEGYDPDTRRRVVGTVTVPNYLDRPQTTVEVGAPDALRPHLPDPADEQLPLAAPGSRFNYLGSDDGLPRQNPVAPTLEAEFVCDVPHDVFEGGRQARPLLYGHGLLGSPHEASGSSASAMREQGFATCATAWIGMATEDLANVATILPDMSNFPSLADRAQQGFLNFLFLGRAMIHREGFTSHPAFQANDDATTAGRPVMATARGKSPAPLWYDGNSQGAIMGGALVAISPDIQRGVLGVPGMNYSTLLNRSVDWEDAYAEVTYAAYPDKMEQQLLFALIQMLWDRAEANGYAQHLTGDPLPNTPAHDVLLHVAFSDHQVANVAAEVEARTIGAPIMVPSLRERLHWEKQPHFGATSAYPHRGSALVYWDSGNATPPNGNIPPEHDGDPHGDPRKEPGGAWQKMVFLLSGWVLDVCDGQPYLTDDHPDAGGEPVCTDFPPRSRR